MNDTDLDDKFLENSTEQEPPKGPSAPRKSLFRRLLRWTAWSIFSLLGIIVALAGGAVLYANSDGGQRWLTEKINSAIGQLPSGLSGSIRGISCALPSRIRMEGIVLKDADGTWLTAEEARLSLDWSALPDAFVISEVALERPALLRAPALENAASAPEPAPAGSPKESVDALGAFLKGWPSWLPEFRLDSFALRHAKLDRGIIGVPFAFSLDSSAAAGRKGLGAALDLVREDMPAGIEKDRCRVQASLSPDLVLALAIDASDMGLASANLPQLSRPSLALRVKGDAPLEDWKARLEGELATAANAHGQPLRALALTGDVGVKPFASPLPASVELKLSTGDGASALWSLAGQKNGKLSLDLKGSVRAGEDVAVETCMDVRLDDMDWGQEVLSSILGRSVSFSSSASLRSTASGGLTADLGELAFRASRLDMDADGIVSLDEKGGISSPASKADIEFQAALSDASGIVQGFSGDALIKGSVRGIFSALDTTLSLQSRRLHMVKDRFDDIEAGLSLPAMDVPRLLSALPQAFAGISGGDKDALSSTGPFLTGNAHASLRVNQQPLRFRSDWRLEEKKTGNTSALLFSLDKLDILAAESASVEGRLSASMPYASPAPSEGSVAAMLGTPLPRLDGALSIAVRDWAPLSAMSRMSFSGAPLSVDLTLDASQKQKMRLTSTLPSFDMEGQLSLSALHADIAADDLWGKPSFAVEASVEEVKAGTMSLSGLNADMRGGLDKVRVKAVCAGDIQSDIDAEWMPGKVSVAKLLAEVAPAALGLSGETALGLAADKPFSLSYGEGGKFSLGDCAFSLLPSGKAVANGAWSGKDFHLRASLEGLALEHLQPLFPEMPAGDVALSLDMAGSPQKPEGTFSLDILGLQMPGSTLPPVDSAIKGKLSATKGRRMLDIVLDVPEHTRRQLGLNDIAFQCAVPFTSPAEGFAIPDMSAPLKGKVQLAGELAQIWKLVPAADQRLAGKAAADVTLRGSASAPVVSARVSVKDGHFVDLVQGVELRGIDLALDADGLDVINRKGRKATMSLSAHDGRKGTVRIGGWFDPGTMALSVDGTLDKLSPLHRQDLSIMLSGTLGVSGTALAPSVRADITVDKGQVLLAKLPGSGITTLTIEEPGKSSDESEAKEVGSLDVQVKIPNQFFIRGYGLDCEWKGDLKIAGPLSRPELTGELEAVRGTLDILSKNFKLSEGRVGFDGGWPVSPMLNIDMEYVASSVTAHILVGGTAGNPKLTLTSQPEMPQDEVLSQILFGQSSGSLSHMQALQLASAAATLAGFGGLDVMGIGRDLLGVDVFKVNSDNDGKDSDVSRSSLEVGTYVRDNIYVGVEQGMGRESETGAVVEIELLPSLEARAKASGSETEFSLEWKKNY